ncbi:MAG TPA: S8 family serine peptidase [Capillimicrobium sp.]|nr:S8 family serine peptidase [Capillimicrobium sp.]
MRRVAPVLLALALVVAPASAAAAPTGRLLVSIDAPHTRAAQAATARAVIARHDVRATSRNVPQVGLVTVEPQPGESIRELAERLRADPAVRSVTREHRARLRLNPNDPAFTTADPAPEALGSSLQWWAIRSRFPAAWDLADGDSVTVAVIDSGVDATHPDIAGNVRRAVDLDSDPLHAGARADENGHGTHVASLACGIPNNGVGLAGAGYGCGLMVEKSDLSDSSVIRALVDATDHGADVISMSIGTDDRKSPPQAMVDAIDYAYDHGVVLVAAAADKSTTEQGDPANILQPTGTGDDITAGKGLSVTAADFDGRRASFAGSGSQISIAAYGAFDRADRADGLLGAFPPPTTEIERGIDALPCRCRAELAGDNRFAFLEGTSMATPIVAGAAALMLDRNPDLHPDDVIRLLKRTATRQGGWSPDLGWGIVDAEAAVIAAGQLDRRPPTSSVVGPRSVSRERVRLRITAADTAAPGIEPAGVRAVRIFASVDGGHPRRVAVTTRRRVVVTVEPGRRYAFFSQAVDREGNVEEAPPRPDVRTRVGVAR